MVYVGNGLLDKSLFQASGLTKPITTYVLTYYDKTAAQTLQKVWQKTAMTPVVTPTSTQFAEGSLIVKAAFITADPTVWPVMAGSQTWPLYITIDATTGNYATPTVVNTYLMQFDIIVKDSKSAPKTGWVFSTLVYDKNAPGKTVWDKMVPLGAQWEVNNPKVGMKSFLLPATTNPPGTVGPNGEYLVSPAPGSSDWLRWFQDRQGNVPMDAGSVAGDFDMVLTFKTLPAWYSATTGTPHSLGRINRNGKPSLMMCNGKAVTEQTITSPLAVQ